MAKSQFGIILPKWHQFICCGLWVTHRYLTRHVSHKPLHTIQGVSLGPPTYFTNPLWTHNLTLVNIHIALIWLLIIQSAHHFAHATTAQLSWHVQNYELIWCVFFTKEQYYFLQNLDHHKLLVTQAPPRSWGSMAEIVQIHCTIHDWKGTVLVKAHYIHQWNVKVITMTTVF